MPPDTRASPAPPDNDPFNYDAAVQEFLRDIPVSHASPPRAPPDRDIDEEVQVKKARKPQPKLDETRLLGPAGIPKLRRLARARPRFRGKGHEFADVAALLHTYQLWLDDLYPRAKFRDALAMVEKLGHTKRMQVSRRAWLDATKARARGRSPERMGDVEGEDSVRGEGEAPGWGEGVEASNAAAGDGTEDGRRAHDVVPDDDDLDALLAENAQPADQASAKPPLRQGPFEQDEASEDDGDDELDALLAEQGFGVLNASSRGAAEAAGSKPRETDQSFADEEEAMREMEGMW